MENKKTKKERGEKGERRGVRTEKKKKKKKKKKKAKGATRREVGGEMCSACGRCRKGEEKQKGKGEEWSKGGKR